MVKLILHVTSTLEDTEDKGIPVVWAYCKTNMQPSGDVGRGTAGLGQ